MGRATTNTKKRAAATDADGPPKKAARGRTPAKSTVAKTPATKSPSVVVDSDSDESVMPSEEDEEDDPEDMTASEVDENHLRKHVPMLLRELVAKASVRLALYTYT